MRRIRGQMSARDKNNGKKDLVNRGKKERNREKLLFARVKLRKDGGDDIKPIE